MNAGVKYKDLISADLKMRIQQNARVAGEEFYESNHKKLKAFLKIYLPKMSNIIFKNLDVANKEYAIANIVNSLKFSDPQFYKCRQDLKFFATDIAIDVNKYFTVYKLQDIFYMNCIGLNLNDRCVFRFLFEEFANIDKINRQTTKTPIIFFIDNAEYLHDNVFNFLKKTMEELLIVFIFFTNSTIIDSIQSRCTEISFDKTPTDKLSFDVHYSDFRANVRNILMTDVDVGNTINRCVNFVLTSSLSSAKKIEMMKYILNEGEVYYNRPFVLIEAIYGFYLSIRDFSNTKNTQT